MLHKISYAHFTEWNNKRKRKAFAAGIYFLSILPEFVLLAGTFLAARGQDGYVHLVNVPQKVVFYGLASLAVLLSAIPLGFFDDKKICKEVRQELRERPRYWKRAIAVYWAVIVAMSSTHIAMLDAIGETARVVGVSGLDYISNPDIQARRDSIGDVGYEGNINYELLLSLDPDLVLLFGVNGASAMESKLKELGIPFMYVGDYLEESPLGKAEWLVALSEVVGKRAKGEKVFADIPIRYNALKQKVSGAVLDAPSVMLNTPYGDSWFMPSTENYAVRLITDAGGDYIYKKNTGNSSTPIDLEEAYLLASEADMWLNVGMANTLDELKAACPKFADTRCVRNGYVYNNNARTNAAGGNDYYESAVVNPDLLLRDLVKIFHPELVEEDFVYYKQLK